MKIRCSRGQTTQDKTFPSTDVAALSGDQRFAGIGGVVRVARERPLGADQLEHRQDRHLQFLEPGHDVRVSFIQWRAAGSNVQRQWEGMISHVKRIVAGGAGSRNLLSAGGESGDIADRQGLRVEESVRRAQSRLAADSGSSGRTSR